MELSTQLNLEMLQLASEVMKQRGFNHTELAKGLGITPSSVHKMLRDQHLTVERLTQLSVVLNYNFFAVLAERLELPEPKTKEQERIHELEIENRTLIKLLKPGND